MMHAVLTAEYFMSPAFCPIELIEDYIEDLLMIRKDVQGGCGCFLLENEIPRKLAELGMYPSEKIYKNNLSKIGEDAYSAKDIARMINSILQLVEEFSGFEDVIVEWETFAPLPDVGLTHRRHGPCADLIRHVGLISYLEVQDIALIHFPKIPSQIAKVSGLICAIEPELRHPPFHVDHDLKVYSGYGALLEAIDASALYASARSEAEITRAIYVGALQVLRSHSSEMKFRTNCFALGKGFVQSLLDHQCYPGQKFSNVCFAIMTGYVAGVPKCQVSPFETSAGSGKQRVKDDHSAWRMHITEGNPALRLMCWESPLGFKTLANVGNKKECEINSL